MTLQDVAHAMQSLSELGASFSLVGKELTVYAPLSVQYPTNLLLTACRAEVEAVVRQKGPYYCGECALRIEPDSAPIEPGSGVLCFSCAAGEASFARLVVLAGHQGITRCQIAHVN